MKNIKYVFLFVYFKGICIVYLWYNYFYILLLLCFTSMEDAINVYNLNA